MLPTILICAVTIVLMIVCILFFPKLKLGKISISTYWLVTLLGAATLLIFGQCSAEQVLDTLLKDSAVNPLKIVVLFLSMTLLSVFLDELGFFGYLANAVLNRAKSGQKKLFFLLYLTVSVLTVFTSNDIIILSFTPFLCFFARNAKIDPIPYLTAEFVAANTWSIALIIGNPTNIYLATSYGVTFIEYLKYSILPAFFAGSAALLALWLVFRKKLSAPMEHTAQVLTLQEKPLLVIGLAHLAVCTIFLSISSYLGLEMWLISLCAAVSLTIFALIYCAIKKKKPAALGRCYKRAPYEIIPFLLSMFVMITALEQSGAITAIGKLLDGPVNILSYGVSSFFTANLINNIPMSVLFSSVLSSAQNAGMGAMFAAVIGSNIGAYLTPVGALAGIMFSNILKEHGVKFGYRDFLKMGIFVALPALLCALGGLALVLL